MLPCVVPSRDAVSLSAPQPSSFRAQLFLFSPMATGGGDEATRPAQIPKFGADKWFK
ncbi:DNA-binding transcriptional LysR family regulator [Sesbania bispinosa]|nr:DNA-binding transcriptional LysR family regulator [Sesbania bispinosa]